MITIIDINIAFMSLLPTEEKEAFLQLFNHT